MSKKIIYLDHAATTSVDPTVFEAMRPYFIDDFGNASSLHQAGLDGRVAVDRAQAKIASFLGCQKEEVYFTSGATESDNMAIFGPIKAIQEGHPGAKIHVLSSSIEHDAVMEPIKALARSGAIKADFLPVDKNGLVSVAQLKASIRPETALVSIMYVNNEIGTIEPIAVIGRLIKKINHDRQQKIIFHTDATQAPAYADCLVDKLGVDLLSLSGHKIYGPKGVGVLYVKKGTPLRPIIFGGHQQNNVRPGTYNVPGIVGLGKAVEILAETATRNRENAKLKSLRDYLIREIKKRVQGVSLTGSLKQRTPNNASFVFTGVEGESVVLMLSQKGIAVSTGSACSSGSLDPSHVLLAIGIKPESAHGSLRVTLGRFTTKKDIDAILRALPPIIKRLREISPLKGD